MRRNRAENDASHAKLTRRAVLLGGAQLFSTVTASAWQRTCRRIASSWCAKMRVIPKPSWAVWRSF